MTTGSRVPALRRTAQILGMGQAIAMITATIWVMIDALTPPVALTPGEQPLTFGDIAPLAVAELLTGVLILGASALLTQPRAGPRLTLLTLESLVLISALAFVGIAALITAPLALATLVCRLLPAGRRGLPERGRRRETTR